MSQLIRTPFHAVGVQIFRYLCQIMNHAGFEINTRDAAGLVLRNLIEMKPRHVGKRGLVPEVPPALLLLSFRPLLAFVLRRLTWSSTRTDFECVHGAWHDNRR